MRDMLSIATLNSRVKFNRTDIPFAEREILGDATETGLAKFAAKFVGDYDKVVDTHSKAFEIPFNSTNKWALVIVRECRHGFANSIDERLFYTAR